MNTLAPLAVLQEPSELPSDRAERHEALVAVFGRFVFWLRKWCLSASRQFIESEGSRSKLGTVRRRYYDGVAGLSPEQREAAMLLVEETLNGFGERLVWALGDEGTDSRFGSKHAYRFRIVMEIVDAVTGDIVEEEVINRGGRFFGSYWGKWLNRYGGESETDTAAD
jgi:hypothetical protein